MALVADSRPSRSRSRIPRLTPSESRNRRRKAPAVFNLLPTPRSGSGAYSSTALEKAANSALMHAPNPRTSARDDRVYRRTQRRHPRLQRGRRRSARSAPGSCRCWTRITPLLGDRLRRRRQRATTRWPRQGATTRAIRASAPSRSAATSARRSPSPPGSTMRAGDAVVIMDADLQHPPEMIETFVARWREGYAMVYGQRTRPRRTRRGSSAVPPRAVLPPVRALRRDARCRRAPAISA